jgi:hypothetical protein
MPKYPSINEVTLTSLRALEVQLKEFPDLLDRDECPYSSAVRERLKALFVAGEVKNYDEDELVVEITALYERVRRESASMTSTDPKDQMQILKTSSDLLTKLVTLKERAMNLRDMARFQKEVIQVLEGLISPAQRAEFIQILGDRLDI